MSDGIVFAGTSQGTHEPEVEAGIHPARFDGVTAKVLESSQFDPKVYEWAFTLLDKDDAVLYVEGEPVEVTGLTSRSVNTASKTTPGAVRYLKALMTPAEYAAFEAGNGLPAEALEGRIVSAIISIKDSGWLKVDGIVGPSRIPTPVKAAKG